MHFTIDSENILTVHETAPAQEADTIAISTEKDIKKATADWPIARLVDVWNGFAGVVPLDDLKPVKKFTDRATALKRIWGAMQRLADQNGQAKKVGQASAPPARHTPATGAPTLPNGPSAHKERGGTHKATVIAMLERAGGASLEEIVHATGWQKHTIRGLVSTLGKKHGYNVTSTRRQDGARVYSIEK